jgi:alcohol dehydrogenase
MLVLHDVLRFSASHSATLAPVRAVRAASSPRPASPAARLDIEQDVNLGSFAVKALVYHVPGEKAWEEVPDPAIRGDTDAIVRVDTTTICGTDLHILKRDTLEVADGRILGHEAVGTVEQVGSGVKSLASGDRVLVSCISACGRCQYCREARSGQCTGGGGWILGYMIDGTQAEYVRVPFADTSTYQVPDGSSDEAILMLSDILPTGYEVGVLNGRVRPGDIVAVVGAGPVGLSAITCARLHTPGHVIAIDLVDARLAAARDFGADMTVNNACEDALAYVKSVTGGRGVDVAIEAAGVPDSFELCTQLVRPGGHVANIGVHGQPATLHLESLWIRDITVTTGIVDTYSTPTLLRLVESRQIDAGRFASHHFALDEMTAAYDVFGHAADTGAIKVVLTR